jgi:histidinol phosphatase-like enzyme
LEALKAFKDKGYKIIAITNRSTKHIPLLPLLQVNQETMGMFEGLLDDLICCPEHSEDVHKPAPTMLLYAMHKHNLNPDNLLMVGDSEDDQGAAEAANVQYVHPSVFFSTDWTNMPDAEAAPINTPYGMSRWVHDPSGNFVGALACCGQDAVAALKARIDEEASRRSLPPPRTIACEEGLSIIIPADQEDFAAWVDATYDEVLPPVE